MNTNTDRNKNRATYTLDRETASLIDRILSVESKGLMCRYCNSRSAEDTTATTAATAIIAAELEKTNTYTWKCTNCGKENIYLGWGWYEVCNSWHDVGRLLRAGLVRITYKSNSSTCYMLNRSVLSRYIRTTASTDTDTNAVANANTGTGESAIPPAEELFGDIIGYDDLKDALYRIITGMSKVHILFVGPPASAKTLFLIALSRLPGAYFISGTNASKAGLLELLFENDISYLLIDEIAELSKTDDAVLYSLMQNGFITETKFGRHRKKEMDTLVFATTNTTRNIATPLLSRFMVINFKPYTYDEFMKIGRHMLRLQQQDNTGTGTGTGISAEEFNSLVHTLWYELRQYDVRIFDKVRELLRAGLTVADILNLLRRYT